MARAQLIIVLYCIILLYSKSKADSPPSRAALTHCTVAVRHSNHLQLQYCTILPCLPGFMLMYSKSRSRSHGCVVARIPTLQRVWKSRGGQFTTHDCSSNNNTYYCTSTALHCTALHCIARTVQ